MARVHFSEGVKKPGRTLPPPMSTIDEDRVDRILEANARTRRQLHRSSAGRQQKKSRSRRSQRRGRDWDDDVSGEMDSVATDQSPLSGVVRYVARRMERGGEITDAAAGANGGGSRHRPRRTLFGAAQAAAFATMALAGFLLTSTVYTPGGFEATNSVWRRMQAATTARVEIKSCVPIAAPRDVKPTITASYPGSGAKLTWKLIRGLTGIMTGDDHDHNGWVGKGQAVSIKTHYPALVSEVTEDLWKDISQLTDRAIVLLRHPLNALPSYHNFEYEQRNSLPNHSTRAPLDAWEAWRDEHYAEQYENWERLARHYMTNFSLENRLVVSFEKMSSKDREVSLAEMRRIGTFLKEGDDRIELVDDDVLPCVWETIVADKRVGFEGKRRHSLRKGGATKYPFRPEQLDDMEAMLRRLSDYTQLKPVMEMYIKMIDEERREQAMPKDAAERGEVREERALQQKERPRAQGQPEAKSQAKEQQGGKKPQEREDRALQGEAKPVQKADKGVEAAASVPKADKDAEAAASEAKDAESTRS